METKLKGAFIIKPQRRENERGFFARVFCQEEFTKRGLTASIAQCNISYNKKKGTFRGMHFQAPPYEEEKIVSCTQGAFLDLIVDLRTDSPTFRECAQVELTAENGYSLYVPKSFAHGFFTLQDHTKVFFQMTKYQHEEYACGFRYDDPAFDIQLPFEVGTVADKDKSYPDLYLLPT
jgi:dTDP-4-dehydrorhamnose 3,5-epimerase